MGRNTLMEWEVTAPMENISTRERSRLVIAQCMEEQDAKNIVDYSVSYRGLEYSKIKLDKPSKL